MTKITVCLSVLLVPVLIMILVNEYVRLSANYEGHKIHGITAINSAKISTTECSWQCHSSTSYCKKHHVKYAKPFFALLDPVYLGIIESLRSTGDYEVSNVIILVFLIPIAIYLLLIRSILIQIEIRKINKEGAGK